MKISIITPVKNLEKYISETIESVLNQRGDFDIEYIIVDGNSVDDTLKICEDYQNQLKAKSRPFFCNSIYLKIISEVDSGMYEALAKGLQSVTGDIVSYINADDFYQPNSFSCLAEVFLKYDSVHWLSGLPLIYNEYGHITSFRVPWQYDKGLILRGYFGKQLPFIQQESVFWRSELNNRVDFEKLKNFKLAGDYFLWHSFAKQGVQLFIIDSFIGGNRLRRGQLSENKELYYNEFNSIKDRINLRDFIRVFFYWFMEIYAGKPIKRRFSKNRISYKNGSWLMK